MLCVAADAHLDVEGPQLMLLRLDLPLQPLDGLAGHFGINLAVAINNKGAHSSAAFVSAAQHMPG